MSQQDTKLDALYTIFEKHLYDFEENAETQEGFIDKIVSDYIKFLVANKVAVPRRWQVHILEELRENVRQMLVKKIYGCLSIEEYRKNQTNKKDIQKLAKKKYSRLF